MAARTTKRRALTPAEAEVMKVLWGKGPATVHEVVDALPRAVAYTTVLTVLRILTTKGYVKTEPNPDGSRAYLYQAAVDEKAARSQHVREFLNRFFSGRPADLVAGLLDDDSLSRADLQTLRKEIDAKLGGGKR